MAILPHSVAVTRMAVRRALADIPHSTVFVAVSGGADSMTLAAAAAFVGPRLGCHVGVITVDHGLQADSSEQAKRVIAWAEETAMSPNRIATVHVEGSGGPEAAARRARYDALERVSHEHGASAVLLGHTRDDQAETVLLGLARGSGPRAIAGMPATRGVLRRPFLDLSRELVRQAAFLQKLPVWEDPHNVDPRFTRSRLREMLPQLDVVVGGGMINGLARTANLIRSDSDFLDEMAQERARILISEKLNIDPRALREEPAPIRTRVIRLWLLALGVPGGALGAVHIDAVEALVSQWHGQGPVQLPGGVVVRRIHDLLCPDIPPYPSS